MSRVTRRVGVYPVTRYLSSSLSGNFPSHMSIVFVLFGFQIGYQVSLISGLTASVCSFTLSC